MAWLDRGRNTTFGAWHDDRLGDLAADLHRRAGRFEVATQLVAEGFAVSPTVAGYQRLQVFAADSKDWDRRRAEALGVLRAMPVVAPPVPGHRTLAESSGHGVLVQVLIAEGDSDGAWVAAQRGGCRSSIWIEVADARGVTHPAGAIRVVQRLGATALDGGNRAACADGAALIRRRIGSRRPPDSRHRARRRSFASRTESPPPGPAGRVQPASPAEVADDLTASLEWTRRHPARSSTPRPDLRDRNAGRWVG